MTQLNGVAGNEVSAPPFREYFEARVGACGSIHIQIAYSPRWPCVGRGGEYERRGIYGKIRLLPYDSQQHASLHRQVIIAEPK